MSASVYQVAWLQGVLVLAISGLLFITTGWNIAISALTGGAVAFANAFIYASRFQRASELAASSPQRAIALIVKSVLIRTALVAILFWVVLGWMKLMPAPAIFMFAGAQGVYWFALKANSKD
ncbi:MAG: ATP synthase subunit I [Proteobacteria bacterium]|nr:ATP synthase subunit I [Pseudomonadota bacterium]MDE3208859.1 ATP synthase subunit I [Pseudomonadota bacterium]